MLVLMQMCVLVLMVVQFLSQVCGWWYSQAGTIQESAVELASKEICLIGFA